MRFAVKLVPIGVLGCAAALLVACGDGNGLLSSSESGSLQDALSAVQSACAGGDSGRAAVAARSFSDRVGALPAGTVDRKLVANLQDGASTLETLIARTCTGAAATTTTPTVTTTTTPTTTATTTTTTTTEPTTPTEPPTTPTEPPTTPTTPTTPPDTGGGTPGGTGTGGTGGAGSGGAGAPQGATP
jgi:hypothetical protein